jgi:hypothetical protein
VYKPLPPGVYPIAVDKYINININISLYFSVKGNKTPVYLSVSNEGLEGV